MGRLNQRSRDMTAPGVDRNRTFQFEPNLEFRLPLLPRLLSLLAVIALTGMSLFMTAFALLVLWKWGWGLGLLLALVACFMAALTAYVGRDLRGKWGLRVALEPDTLVLDLPEHRSLIHHPP